MNLECKQMWDPTLEQWTVPHSCPVCNRCRIIVGGPARGMCVHGGPYKGYVTTVDKLNPPVNKVLVET